MSQISLNVENRTETGKGPMRRLRVAGRVPAVIYGHKEAPQALSINARELRDLLAHKGSHGLLMLQENGTQMPAIIKVLQRHPVSHKVASVDFLRVSLNEEVTAHVPVVLSGEPEAVRTGDGILVQSLLEMTVSALPQNLPESITVDVSQLELNGAPIHVGEITMPEGVKAVTPAEDAIAVVNLPEPEEELPAGIEENVALEAENEAETQGAEAAASASDSGE